MDKCIASVDGICRNFMGFSVVKNNRERRLEPLASV